MEKVLTVAILGCGSRGADSYGLLMNKDERYRIVSLCDIRQEKLDRFSEVFKVAKENCFLTEDEFFAKKRADVCVIATQDADHVRHALKALELGYDLLLEKPITPIKEECYSLLAAQKKYGGKVLVCHVLRYNQAYNLVDKMIKDGEIGKLVDIHAIEQVSYWHQAHSYVRGNWRKSETSSPMITAKCCHDLDLIQHYAGARCESVSSIGSLTLFKKENKPEGASNRCMQCKHKDTCPYSAPKIYLGLWNERGRPVDNWPMNVVSSKIPLTEEGILEAIDKGPYGQCVYECDNNVVDHEETNMLFENGVTANLCMTAFTGVCGRTYRFHGTMGDISLIEEEQKIVIHRFGKPVETIPFSGLPDVSGGHGGGDAGLVHDLYDLITTSVGGGTTLEESIESHLMAIASEESRLAHGERIVIKHFE